ADVRVAIAQDGISLIGLMHGRRQVGCRPLGAAPLKCAVCGTVISWPNGKATASRTCPGTLADLAAAGRQERPFCAAQPRRSHHRRSPHSRRSGLTLGLKLVTLSDLPWLASSAQVSAVLASILACRHVREVRTRAVV